MSESALQIIANLHPMSEEPVYAEMRAGQTIAQALGELASHSLSVSVGGYEVPRALWGKARPKAGQMVHITMYPQGGSAGKWVRIIALAVLTYFTMGAGAAWAGGLSAATGISTSVIYAAAFVVGTLAINALVPPPTMKGLNGSGGDPFQRLNSLTGTSNQTNPYGVIPCVVGQTRFYPCHAALPYKNNGVRLTYSVKFKRP